MNFPVYDSAGSIASAKAMQTPPSNDQYNHYMM